MDVRHENAGFLDDPVSDQQTHARRRVRQSRLSVWDMEAGGMSELLQYLLS